VILNRDHQSSLNIERYALLKKGQADALVNFEGYKEYVAQKSGPSARAWSHSRVRRKTTGSDRTRTHPSSHRWRGGIILIPARPGSVPLQSHDGPSGATAAGSDTAGSAYLPPATSTAYTCVAPRMFERNTTHLLSGVIVTFGSSA
jgi:hypothetical protein